MDLGVARSNDFGVIPVERSAALSGQPRQTPCWRSREIPLSEDAPMAARFGGMMWKRSICQYKVGRATPDPVAERKKEYEGLLLKYPLW